MRLERHVGGLSRERKNRYLRAKGWAADDGRWIRADLDAPLKIARALHIQLTEDLTLGMTKLGWRVVDYSQRGYAKMNDREGKVPDCSLPKALRVQARREKRPVADLTYELFLAALLDAGA